MIDSRILPLLRAAAACAVLSACAREPEPTNGRTAGADSALADTTFTPEPERVTLPTSRIYHTLTTYEWYARGEPLLHDGRAYRPEGMPISASLTEMSRAGEFRGVEYYVRDGDSSPAVYVPVFQGYWQRFRLDPDATVSPVDDAVPVDTPDSTAAGN